MIYRPLSSAPITGYLVARPRHPPLSTQGFPQALWAVFFLLAGTMGVPFAGPLRDLRPTEKWRERLEELVNHREEREQVEGKRRYLERKRRRLNELYLEGQFDRREYDRLSADLDAQLDSLRVPERPDVEGAGEMLESLGAEWANAPLRIQRDMLRMIFEAVYVDVLGRRLVCVKPHPPFVPLFRMDGLEESEDGCFYCEEDEEARSES